MRIASLVPSATEMLFALGLGDSVVAVTHECDYPPEAAHRTRLTRSVIPEGLPAAEIDAAVRSLTAEGKAIYELDEDALAELGVELIVTQSLCPVCAVSEDDVRAVAARMPTRPRVISLDPAGLSDVLDDVLALGGAAEAPEAATALRASLEQRLAVVREATAGVERPGVLALEWLDPPYVGGHWVPEMIDLAGGADVAGVAGLKSRRAGWTELAAAEPDVVVAMPCGWSVPEARAQAIAHWDQLEELGARSVYAVDAAASFSRPGPRLVDGTELLAHLLHPDRADPPQGVGFELVDAPAVTA